MVRYNGPDQALKGQSSITTFLLLLFYRTERFLQLSLDTDIPHSIRESCGKGFLRIKVGVDGALPP